MSKPNYAYDFGSFDGRIWLNCAHQGPLPRAAEEAAKKALNLDDDISEAHVSMGVIRIVFDSDWKEAEKELRRAIALNPNNFDAHREYALLLFRTYRYDAAEQEFFLSKK